MTAQDSLRKQLTTQIVTSIEKGVIPWRRPWACVREGRHQNAITQRPYTGINPLLLELQTLELALTSRHWATFKQWNALGYTLKRRPHHVAPGGWGAKIIFSKPLVRTRVDKTTGKKLVDKFFVMRSYTVFAADQVEGADQFLPTIPASTEPDFEPAERLIEAVVDAGVDFSLGGDRAFYRRPTPEGSFPHHTSGDSIQMPHKAQFETLGAFYESFIHEAAHASEVRLGWAGPYEMGELVAEIASCFVAQAIGVPNGEGLENHASYLASWLRCMNDDPSFIFKASTQASKVADLLLSLVPCGTAAS